MRWIGIAVAAGFLMMGLTTGNAVAAAPKGVDRVHAQACISDYGFAYDHPSPCKRTMTTTLHRESGLSREAVGISIRLRGACKVDEYGDVIENAPVQLVIAKPFRPAVRTANLCEWFSEGPAFEKVLGANVVVAFPRGNARHLQRTTRWAVRSRGRLVASGRVVIKVKVLTDASSRRIWQGTDAFINVCINEGYRLWSSGGRLYCTVTNPATARATVRLR